MLAFVRSIVAALIVATVVTSSCHFVKDKMPLGGVRTTATPLPDGVMILVDSTALLGLWYKLEISSSGDVVFTPEKYTGYGDPEITIGVPIRKKITSDQVNEIVKTIETSGFFDLYDEYKSGSRHCPSHVMDGRGVRISVTINGRSKHVSWLSCYQVGNQVNPKEFGEVEDKINEIANISQLH